MNITDMIYLSHQMRLQLIELISDSILEEYENKPEYIDSADLQKAVECQVSINRVVYLLNRKQEEEYGSVHVY